MRALMKGDERRGAARLAATPCSFAATASGLTASFISSEVLLLPGLLKPLAAPEKARICVAKGRSRAVCCAKLLSMMCLDEIDEWGGHRGTVLAQMAAHAESDAQDAAGGDSLNQQNQLP